MLATQLFSIDAGRDTTLETMHGAFIRITEGSFSVKGNVQIEIREAFTPAEILASGLTTESDGNPLRSGGMIYINATAGGDSVGLVKPIGISIPNQYYDSAMQVFKGVQTDSSINWVDPQPVDTTPQSQQWVRGKALFRSKCSSCHRLFTPLTGPALAGVENRWPDKSKLYEWVKNNPRLIKSGYPYAVNISKFSPSEMTPFSAMTDEDINAILAYIKNEEKRPGAIEEDGFVGEFYPSDTMGMPDTSLKSVLPCGKKDTVYLPIPRQELSFFQEQPPVNFQNSPATDTSSITTFSGKKYLDDPSTRVLGLSDFNSTTSMYDFRIEAFGWYNIDAEMEGYAGTSIVKVWAQAQVEFDIDLHVYLFCPDKQILSVGYEKQEGNKYFFNKINGGVPLFLNDRAVLFSFGSKDDKIYYGISEFYIKKHYCPTKIIKG